MPEYRQKLLLLQPPNRGPGSALCNPGQSGQVRISAKSQLNPTRFSLVDLDVNEIIKDQPDIDTWYVVEALVQQKSRLVGIFIDTNLTDFVARDSIP